MPATEASVSPPSTEAIQMKNPILRPLTITGSAAGR